MKITIDIDTPEEMKEISSFLEKKKEKKKRDLVTVSERRKRLEKLFKDVRGHMPEGYKFDRDSLYDYKLCLSYLH